MEARIAKLETDVGEIKGVLGRLEPAIAAIAAEQREFRKEFQKTGLDVAEIKGQLKHMPTIWAMAAFVVAIFGFAFLLVRFASGR